MDSLQINSKLRTVSQLRVRTHTIDCIVFVLLKGKWMLAIIGSVKQYTLDFLNYY